MKYTRNLKLAIIAISYEIFTAGDRRPDRRHFQYFLVEYTKVLIQK